MIAGPFALGIAPRVSSAPASRLAFIGVSAALFALGTAATIVGCASMSAMGEMPMPGGWTMSMTWMRMPGQTWPGTAAAFLGMWIMMMMAMMLPSLMPVLSRYRDSVAAAGTARVGRLTLMVGLGYFLSWTVLGMAVFALGIVLATLEMQWPALARAVPMLAAMVVLIAGALQFTAWKRRQLACCRQAPCNGRSLVLAIGTPWRYGVHLGRRCIACCAGFMAVLLVLGVMDLRVMAAVTAAITVERLGPAGERVAQAIGVVVVAGGLLMMAGAGLR